MEEKGKEKKANEGIKKNEKQCIECGKFYGTNQAPSLCGQCFVKFFSKLK